MGGVSDGAIINNVNRYNAVTNTWSPLADMISSGEAPCAAVSNGKIYAQEGSTAQHVPDLRHRD